MVECTQGGYDGRFDRGENTKADFETRTLAGHWQPDASIYRSRISTEEALDHPVLATLAIQEIEGRRLRDNYRKKVKTITYNQDAQTLANENEILRRRGFFVPYF